PVDQKRLLMRWRSAESHDHQRGLSTVRIVEASHVFSFVQKKTNKQWVWLAMDATTRPVMALHMRDRSHTSARRLLAKMSLVYRQHATFYTDQYVVYTG